MCIYRKHISTNISAIKVIEANHSVQANVLIDQINPGKAYSAREWFVVLEEGVTLQMDAPIDYNADGDVRNL